MLCSWWVCMCSYLNSMFNNVVAKKSQNHELESATTAFKKTHIKSTKKPSPPKASQKKIETNQSDPDPDPKQKKNKKGKSSPIRIMVGRQIIIIITTLSLYMCVFVSTTPSSTRAAVTSTPSSGLVCSFFWPATTPPTSPKSPSTQLLPSRYKNHTWRHSELCEFLRFCSMWLHRRGSPEGLF